jgi:hypothetical protein
MLQRPVEPASIGDRLHSLSLEQIWAERPITRPFAAGKAVDEPGMNIYFRVAY